MVKIKGADSLSRKLSGAADAFAGLDDEIGKIAFDPKDADSVAAAIQVANGAIEKRIRKHPGNAIVKMTGAAMKDSFRQQIEAKAAEHSGE